MHGNEERVRFDTVPAFEKDYHNRLNGELARLLMAERGAIANTGHSWGVMRLYRGFTQELIAVAGSKEKSA